MNVRKIIQHLNIVKPYNDTSKSSQREAPTEKPHGGPIKEIELENGSTLSEKVLVSLCPISCYTPCLSTAYDER